MDRCKKSDYEKNQELFATPDEASECPTVGKEVGFNYFYDVVLPQLAEAHRLIWFSI